MVHGLREGLAPGAETPAAQRVLGVSFHLDEAAVDLTDASAAAGGAFETRRGVPALLARNERLFRHENRDEARGLGGAAVESQARCGREETATEKIAPVQGRIPLCMTDHTINGRSTFLVAGDAPVHLEIEVPCCSRARADITVAHLAPNIGANVPLVREVAELRKLVEANPIDLFFVVDVDHQRLG